MVISDKRNNQYDYKNTPINVEEAFRVGKTVALVFSIASTTLASCITCNPLIIFFAGVIFSGVGLVAGKEIEQADSSSFLLINNFDGLKTSDDLDVTGRGDISDFNTKADL